VEPGGRTTVPLVHDGHDRPYVLHVPPGPRDRPLPLLLELHGRGISAGQFDALTGFGALADEEGFVLAMPSAIAELWNDGRSRSPKWVGEPDDVGYLTAVIDDACSRKIVDPARVYVVGMSNGAVMAGRLACECADNVAAVAQVAGTAGRAVAAGCRPTRATPILNIHGTADRYSPYEGGIRHSLGARLILRRAAGPMIGVDDWADFWVAANGALDGPLVGPEMGELPPDTTFRAWRGASNASDVVFYRIEGGGHTWPSSRTPLPAFIFGRTSGTFDTARLCWEFLAAHTR
jgi:polyhydroxybutyrate depolymerase